MQPSEGGAVASSCGVYQRLVPAVVAGRGRWRMVQGHPVKRSVYSRVGVQEPKAKSKCYDPPLCLRR